MPNTRATLRVFTVTQIAEEVHFAKVNNWCHIFVPVLNDVNDAYS
jgi:hypothetical protein